MLSFWFCTEIMMVANFVRLNVGFEQETEGWTRRAEGTKGNLWVGEKLYLLGTEVFSPTKKIDIYDFE